MAGLFTLVALVLVLAFQASAATAAPSDPSRFRFGNEVVTWWAPLQTSVTARSRPAAGAPTVARVAVRTPEGTTTIVRLLERVSRGGRLWLKVSLPVLPNGTTGWIQREDVGGYQRTTRRLVVDLGDYRATLFDGRRRLLTAPVGIGQRRWPTPTGTFFVRNQLTKFASPAYGPVAFGLSARSAVLTDWPAGGFVGIHGTNRPAILPGRVSHGCIRLRNADILRLARLLAPGDLVVIR